MTTMLQPRETFAFDAALGRKPTRLVLVGSNELVWQRARYRQGRYLREPTDPLLI